MIVASEVRLKNKNSPEQTRLTWEQIQTHGSRSDDEYVHASSARHHAAVAAAALLAQLLVC